MINTILMCTVMCEWHALSLVSAQIAQNNCHYFPNTTNSGIIGSAMGKTGEQFGPQLLLVMCISLLVSKPAEPSAMVTCLMLMGPMMFHV